MQETSNLGKAGGVHADLVGEVRVVNVNRRRPALVFKSGAPKTKILQYYCCTARPRRQHGNGMGYMPPRVLLVPLATTQDFQRTEGRNQPLSQRNYLLQRWADCNVVRPPLFTCQPLPELQAKFAANASAPLGLYSLVSDCITTSKYSLSGATMISCFFDLSLRNTRSFCITKEQRRSR
jgi:hypothetical protein